MKLLSILIPAFHFPEGVGYILENLTASNSDLIEIIVGDDSEDERVFCKVSEFYKDCGNFVKYQRNKPSLGAVSNWNALLKRACGKYVVLMHHDEFPLGDSWLNNLLEELEKDQSVDVILMSCVLFRDINYRLRVHLPKIIQRFVLKYFPSYLFRRNIIGPTSCLVIRRTILPSFDNRLQWLVDVDFYWRLFALKPNWKISEKLQIASLSSRATSITHSLSTSLSQIRKNELLYLNVKYTQNILWLSPHSNRFIFFIEIGLWRFFKLLYIAYNWAIEIISLSFKSILKKYT